MWLILATMASMFWGASYAINDQLYRHISVYSALALQMLIISLGLIVAAASTGTLSRDVAVIVASRRVFWLFVAAVAAWGVAELCINFSIQQKNASFASLIEISYPLFVAFFAYILFDDADLNTMTALGGACIAFGVYLIWSTS